MTIPKGLLDYMRLRSKRGTVALALLIAALLVLFDAVAKARIG
jgi:hypothetical protein